MPAMVETHTDAHKVHVIEAWPAPKKAWVPGAEAVAADGRDDQDAHAGSREPGHGYLAGVQRVGALIVFLVGVGIATTWIWPPVFNGVAKLVIGH